MSQSKQPHSSDSRAERGTTLSYIFGFLLSLEFTIIPYSMVVNQTVTGSALLTTILVFAVLQMLVQIIFFLHLGRGPKPLYNVAFYVATVGMILVVTVGSVLIMSNLHGRMSPDSVTQKLAQKEGIAQVSGYATGACQQIGDNHKVFIADGRIDVAYIEAKRCDTITFINQEKSARQIVFGIHPKHDEYGGESEISVGTRRPESITLNQTGTFNYHDHAAVPISGSFVVEP